MFPVSLTHDFPLVLPYHVKDISVADCRVLVRSVMDEMITSFDRDLARKDLRGQRAIGNALLKSRVQTMHRESETGFSNDGDESFYFDGLRDSRVSFFMTAFHDGGDLNSDKYTRMVRDYDEKFFEYIELVDDFNMALNKIVDLLISANPASEAFLVTPSGHPTKRRLLMDNIERLATICGLSLPLVIARYLACIRFNYPIWVRGLAAAGSYGTLNSIALRLRVEIRD